MADEASNNREARLLDHDLDGVGDVGEVVPDLSLLDAGGQCVLADGQQALGDGRDLADRHRDGAVGDEAVQRHAEVDGDQVAFLRAISGRDAVHDHRVRRDAERSREALVALRRRDPASRGDVLVGNPVELEHRDADLEMLGDQLQRLVDELACARHAFDLLLGLADDHARACTCSSTSEISAHTSSIGRSACTWTSLPLVR